MENMYIVNGAACLVRHFPPTSRFFTDGLFRPIRMDDEVPLGLASLHAWHGQDPAYTDDETLALS